MKKKIVITGPVFSRSGYGEMARFAFRSLKNTLDYNDLYIIPTNWGGNGNIADKDEETRELHKICLETHNYIASTNNNPNFDISVQISIPNEWKPIAAKNIGYTAGIETNNISPAWLNPSNQMDQIIVISEHAKSSFINTIFSDDKGQNYKVEKRVDV